MENISQIETSRIIANQDNPRSEIGECQDLISSIKQNGLIQPITVRWTKKMDKDGIPTGYEVIAGSRRLTALKALGMEKIPCIVMTCDDKTAFEIATVENLVRENMTRVDEAKAVAKLLDEGRGRQEVASIFGKTPRWVEGRRKIVELGKKALEMLEEGKINFGHAEMLTLANPDDVDHFLEIARYNTPEQLKKSILDERKSLQNAPFNFNKLCDGCPNRSDCQKDLFGDVEIAYCLNEDCFEMKVNEFVKAKTAQFKKLGYEPVPEDEKWAASNCLTYPYYKGASSYINAETDDGEARKIIDKLRKQGVKARYFFDKNDHQRLVFRKADANEPIEDEDEREEKSVQDNSYAITQKAGEMAEEALYKKIYKLVKEIDETLAALIVDTLTYGNKIETEVADSDGSTETIDEGLILHVGEKIPYGAWDEKISIHEILAHEMTGNLDDCERDEKLKFFKLPTFEKFKEKAEKALEEEKESVD